MDQYVTCKTFATVIIQIQAINILESCYSRIKVASKMGVTNHWTEVDWTGLTKTSEIS